MLREEIEELERLEREATPGPWKAFDKEGVIAIMTKRGKEVIKWTGFDGSDFQKKNSANARLFAALRNAAPALLAAAKENEELRARITRLTDTPSYRWMDRADKAEAALAEALEVVRYYADQYCEGWCKDAGASMFEYDCGGCRAAAFLAKHGGHAAPASSEPVQGPHVKPDLPYGGR